MLPAHRGRKKSPKKETFVRRPRTVISGADQISADQRPRVNLCNDNEIRGKVIDSGQFGTFVWKHDKIVSSM